MTKPWELISREHKGRVGRRAVVEKTFRLPDGRQAAFMVTGDSANRAVACIAVTARRTVLIAEQYRPGPERIYFLAAGANCAGSRSSTRTSSSPCAR